MNKNRCVTCIAGCMQAVIILLMMGWGVSSCTGGHHPIVIHRLDRQISKGMMPDDSLSIKATELLFEISGYPYATGLTVADYSEKPSIREHLGGVEREYADMSEESIMLGGVFERMRELLPEMRVPEVFTIISPFSQSIIVADTTLFIGLNHYLGADYVHYEYFPDYVRVLKERDRMPIDVAEALIRTSYPFHSDEGYPTVASRLAYEGAVVEAVMLVTGESEARVLGYDDNRYGWLCENEKDVGQAIVGRQMLFSDDFAVIRSLVDPAPHASVISPEVPGRAGRFIGHRLVKAYMDNNPDVDLQSLLKGAFYNSSSLLTLAKYNP